MLSQYFLLNVFLLIFVGNWLLQVNTWKIMFNESHTAIHFRLWEDSNNHDFFSQNNIKNRLISSKVICTIFDVLQEYLNFLSKKEQRFISFDWFGLNFFLRRDHIFGIVKKVEHDFKLKNLRIQLRISFWKFLQSDKNYAVK